MVVVVEKVAVDMVTAAAVASELAMAVDMAAGWAAEAAAASGLHSRRNNRSPTPTTRCK